MTSVVRNPPSRSNGSYGQKRCPDTTSFRPCYGPTLSDLASCRRSPTAAAFYRCTNHYRNTLCLLEPTFLGGEQQLPRFEAVLADEGPVASNVQTVVVYPDFELGYHGCRHPSLTARRYHLLHNLEVIQQVELKFREQYGVAHAASHQDGQMGQLAKHLVLLPHQGVQLQVLLEVLQRRGQLRLQHRGPDLVPGLERYHVFLQERQSCLDHNQIL
jgi:hypothetical protein